MNDALTPTLEIQPQPKIWPALISIYFLLLSALIIIGRPYISTLNPLNNSIVFLYLLLSLLIFSAYPAGILLINLFVTQKRNWGGVATFFLPTILYAAAASLGLPVFRGLFNGTTLNPTLIFGRGDIDFTPLILFPLLAGTLSCLYYKLRSSVHAGKALIFSGLIFFASLGYLYYKINAARYAYAHPPTITPVCVSEEGGTPFIYTFNNFAPLGETLELGGCNLAGFEGDTNVWIENTQGEKGILYGDRSYSTNEKIAFTLTSPTCQTDNSYSGLPCDKPLNLIPGKYKLYVMPWDKKSNEIPFTIPTPEEYAQSYGMTDN